MNSSVSVIITCFNLERYIGAAIESVLRQDHPKGVEIIVVDDCSTDGSAAIIQSFEQVRQVRTARNGGVLLAMLAGLEASSGEIVMFLDGDDIWEPDKISAVVGCFASDPALALVTHDLRFIDRDGQPIPRRSRSEDELRSMSADEVDARLREGILSMGDYVWLGSAFAIRRTISRVEEFAAFARSLPDPANTYQDWPLAYWVASNAALRLGYIDRKLFAYRVHEANYSGDVRTASRAARNFMRSCNTVEAQVEIARRRGLPMETIDALEARAQSYRYLADLHRGRRLKALRGFAGAWPDFARRKLIGKELLRLAGVQILGPERFAAMSSRRRIMREMPTS